MNVFGTTHHCTSRLIGKDPAFRAPRSFTNDLMGTHCSSAEAWQYDIVIVNRHLRGEPCPTGAAFLSCSWLL